MARVTEPELIRLELDWYNQLLPRRDHLQAALILAGSVPLADNLTIQLELDGVEAPAKLLTGRPADRVTGAAQWLEFALFPAERKILADRRRLARFTAHYDGDHHVSAHLSDDIRQSLLDDLRVARRDAA